MPLSVILKKETDLPVSVFNNKKSDIARVQILKFLQDEKSKNPDKEYLFEKDVRGKPQIEVSKYSGDLISYGVSISHSYPYVLSVLHKDKFFVGCDIERIRSLKDSFVSSFLNNQEISFAKKNIHGYDAGVIFAWTIKESILKAMGVGIRISPKRVTIESILEGGKVGEYSVRLDESCFNCCVEEIMYLDGFVMTIVTIAVLPENFSL
jgi:phosphopantetheinyl transferase